MRSTMSGAPARESGPALERPRIPYALLVVFLFAAADVAAVVLSLAGE